MELAASAWIPILVAVAAIALAVGWSLRGLRSRESVEAVAGLRAELEGAITARDAAVADADAARADLETLTAEVTAERRGRVEAEEELEARRLERAQGRGEGERPVIGGRAGGAGDDARPTFRDVVGLEAELASLRVIAARARALEARVAELEAGQVIDLREPSDDLVD